MPISRTAIGRLSASIAYLGRADGVIIYADALQFATHMTLFPAAPESAQVPITRDFTATTFVVQHGCTLLLLHRKLGKWFPPGGHIDANELPDVAALREVREESGLEVELLSQGRAIGAIRMLPQPHCILLEDIAPGHQHIDLIYFAAVVGGSLVPSEREASAARWFSWDALADPQIADDIRELGRRAIECYRPGAQRLTAEPGL